MRAFTDGAAVRKVVRELENELGEDKQFSDIIDGRGHQYVDLVLEGGGVLGIALVGYLYALERVGIRFLQIGGTSAGSIVALLLAALGTPAEAKSREIIRHLATVDLFSFIDGDDDARDFVDAVIEGSGRYTTLWKAGQVRDNLIRDLGLAAGEAFSQWLRATLAEAGIESTRELEQRLRTLPDSLGVRGGDRMTVEEASPRLAVIAADVTTQTKVQFPEMADLYWAEPEAVHPAEYVRASMSVPFLFQPMRIERVPRGPRAWDRWLEVGYDEDIPESCTLVDGGTMSNFPINLFHGTGVPTAPTFGAKLTSAGRRQEVNDPQSLLKGIFNAARNTLDYDFVLRNPDYTRLVTRIDTSGHDWLDFRMGAEAKQELFLRGVEAAGEFLFKFDWAAYKKLRAQTAAAGGAAGGGGPSPA